MLRERASPESGAPPSRRCVARWARWRRPVRVTRGIARVQRLDRAIRVVGDDPVHSESGQGQHLVDLVDGPDHHSQAERVGLGQRLFGHVTVVRRPDGAPRRFHQARHGTAERLDVEPRGPGRRAGTTAEDVVNPALLGGEANGGEVGRELPCFLENSPVEGLEIGPVEHSLGTEHRDHRAGEFLRTDGLLRRQGRHLGLDVEANRPRSGPSSEGQHLRQRRNARAVARILIREPLRNVAARRRATDIEPGQRGQVQRVEERSRRREPLSRRVAGAVRIERPVVVDDGHPVPRYAEVELQHVDADLDGALERRDGVLGKQPAGAAVTLDLHRVRGHRAESAEQGDQRDSPQKPPRMSDGPV